MINQQALDILYVKVKLVIAPLRLTIWPTFFSFFVFCSYFTLLKAREIKQQNIRNLGNIRHILLGTVR